MQPIDCNTEQMRSRIARSQTYLTLAATSDAEPRAAETIFGARITALMAHPETRGRFAGPKIPAPRCSCTAFLKFAPSAKSASYHNRDFVEIFMCLEGRLTIDLGTSTVRTVTIEKDDLFAVPAGVQHLVRNPDPSRPAVTICILNGPADCQYTTVVTDIDTSISAEQLGALGVRKGSVGEDITEEALAKNTARFAKLQPYKHSLASDGGLPPAAVEYLTASSVYPVLVPEKYNGRNRHAPLRGQVGLNLSIAECVPGDGPLPHAHSQTQESFFALEGEWEVSCGNDMSCVIPLKQFDLVGLPVKAMRAFKNTGTTTARLLVIIQQDQSGMTDIVAYTPQVGEEVRSRYGQEVVEAFQKTNFAFDATP